MTARCSRRVRQLLAAVAAVLFASVLAFGVHPPAASAAVDPAEWEMLRLTNESRAAGGLAPLKMHVRVSDGAASWSTFMAEGRCAGGEAICHHPNPAAEITAGCGCAWTAIGENVGVGSGLADLQSRFMDSQTHRDNIMDAAFRYVGVGIHQSGGRVFATLRFYNTNDAQSTATPPGTTPTTPPATTPPVPATATNTGQFVVGDFNGNGRAESLHYQPGANIDRIREGGANRTLSGWSTISNVVGNYRPQVGDFNGDGRDDIFWYAPGSAADSMWFGTSTLGRFSPLGVRNVLGSYQPHVGDFNGDGSDDVFWYAPGTPADSMWYGTTTAGQFIGVSVGNVFGSYQPHVGDFSGDGRDDIFWYAPGSASDSMWQFTSTRGGFNASATPNVHGAYRPAIGDFDGSGHDDIYWYSPGNASDSIWYYTGPTGMSYLNVTQAAGGDYAVFADDFDGDGFDDVYFATVTSTSSYLAFGQSARARLLTTKVS